MMVNGRVVEASEDKRGESMENVLMTNISGDIGIVLDEESKEESNESFIVFLFVL